MQFFPLSPGGIQKGAGLERRSQQGAVDRPPFSLKDDALGFAVTEGHDAIVEAIELQFDRLAVYHRIVADAGVADAAVSDGDMGFVLTERAEGVVDGMVEPDKAGRIGTAFTSDSY